MTDDERAICDLLEIWFDATRKGGTAAVLGLMTEDAVVMVPGTESFGREAFAAARDGMKGAWFDGAVEVKELRVLDDWARLRAHIRPKITSPDRSPAIRRSGLTLTVLRKGADRRWRLARDANLLSEDP